MRGRFLLVELDTQAGRVSPLEVAVDDPQLAKEIQRRFEAGRTDVAIPFSLTATYLASFAGRLALPYVLGWTCYVLFGGG